VRLGPALVQDPSEAPPPSIGGDAESGNRHCGKAEGRSRVVRCRTGERWPEDSHGSSSARAGGSQGRGDLES